MANKDKSQGEQRHEKAIPADEERKERRLKRREQKHQLRVIKRKRTRTGSSPASSTGGG
jgi:hypothetical protein